MDTQKNAARSGAARPLALLFTLALLSACGGGGGGKASAPATPPAAPPEPLLSAAEACAGLQGMAVSASEIALPTAGAVVSASALRPAAGAGVAAVGEYCQVTGVIRSVDRSAPVIRFQVNLPTDWNTKAIQLMGGGFDGSVVTGAGNVPGASGFASPLARGYATFGSDSGHQGSSAEASFALNDEALENYLGDQLRKTRDVAVGLMVKRYRAAPSRTYSAGGSGGGREALYVADRWPELYHGVIAYYPAWELTAMLTNYNRIAKALAAPGAWPNRAKQGLILNSVVAACDALDGASDGVVSHVAACNFDPQTIRCAGGADTGDTCLSDAQIAGVSGFSQRLNLPFNLATGSNSYSAFNVFNGATSLLGSGGGSVAPSTPSTTAMPFAHFIGESFIRYFVTRDSNFDTLQFDLSFATTAFFRHRLEYISSRQDIRTDLSPFAQKGGKVLLVHGTADDLIPSGSSDDFVARLTASMGAGPVADFLRYYVIPGYGHGSGAFAASWDSLTALEDWVERGIAPSGKTVRDTNAAANNRTRPLCAHPTWPRYNGVGDLDVAASYTCTP